MSKHASRISTTVRNIVGLQTLRIGFALGRILRPQNTLHRAVRLFSTPFASSRSRALAAPTHGARESRLDVDGLSIATYAWGDPSRQPYVLFAHGWSSHGTRIAKWIEPLQSSGYAVVAFDQAGHGRSGGQRTTLPDFACHLMAVARHFGPAAAVIGHSLGGAAAAVALARGLQAERAVLIAPAADPLAAMERFSRFVGLGTAFAARMAAFFEARTRVPIEELQAHRNAPLIARPALIVHDLEDREVPWHEGERYARLWNGARLISTRGFGHNRIADHPGVIGDALRFLRGETVGERLVSSPNLPYGMC
ncbi:alpha/beta hydrolase [Lysobacter brunescens]|uniref:Alpha/beta hydrolase n=1 Tax=Lysobacter brunescens TaxID=262323 RepID=A0ABW2YH49_9GAMM